MYVHSCKRVPGILSISSPVCERHWKIKVEESDLNDLVKVTDEGVEHAVDPSRVRLRMTSRMEYVAIGTIALVDSTLTGCKIYAHKHIDELSLRQEDKDMVRQD